jgi:hypothetical protein
MNQNRQRQRRRKPLPWFSLALIAMVGAIVLPVIQRGTAAIAQTFNSDSRSPQLYQQQLNPITRDGFNYIRQLGGRQDAAGNYERPVPSNQAFGAQLQDGWHQAPMNWDDQGSSVLYRVQNGAIVQQDYRWNRGEQR